MIIYLYQIWLFIIIKTNEITSHLLALHITHNDATGAWCESWLLICQDLELPRKAYFDLGWSPNWIKKEKANWAAIVIILLSDCVPNAILGSCPGLHYHGGLQSPTVNQNKPLFPFKKKRKFLRSRPQRVGQLQKEKKNWRHSLEEGKTQVLFGPCEQGMTDKYPHGGIQGVGGFRSLETQENLGFGKS